jgi:hypothetical protein
VFSGMLDLSGVENLGTAASGRRQTGSQAGAAAAGGGFKGLESARNIWSAHHLLRLSCRNNLSRAAFIPTRTPLLQGPRIAGLAVALLVLSATGDARKLLQAEAPGPGGWRAAVLEPCGAAFEAHMHAQLSPGAVGRHTSRRRQEPPCCLARPSGRFAAPEGTPYGMEEPLQM